MSTAFGYWEYYVDSFDWRNGRTVPDLAHTRSTYKRIGIPADEADALIRSGFVMLTPNVVVDRYYGGALTSSDLRTRIFVDQFADWYLKAKVGECDFPSRAARLTATSMTELESQIGSLQARRGRPLVFRGQVRHHKLIREIQNPSLALADLGEVSLVPSLWRQMLQRNKLAFHWFSGLGLLEWSKIIYAQFDLEEIDRRVNAANAHGEWIHSAQDMEDSEDSLLQSFGRVRLDLTMGMDRNLADLLNTLLQHYGLLSPYLDLTTDLRTALYFASHRYEPGQPKAQYQYVGTNKGNSVIYVFRQDPTEMHGYASDRVLHDLKPLRPERQSCVICRSSPYALNLAADFLVAAIRIEFELPEFERNATTHLFPGPELDSFLHVLQKECQQPHQVSVL